MVSRGRKSMLKRSKDNFYKALLSILDEAVIAIAVIILLILARLPLILILVVAVISSLILILLFYSAYQALIRSSYYEIIGKKGEVVEELNPRGLILVDGVLWQAENVDGKSAIPKGAKVIIVKREGLIVKVKRINNHK